MEESFSPCYGMSNLYRGLAVIIANENFKGMSIRDGAKQDADKMQALFKSLDFHVTTFMDLKADDMMKVIKKASGSIHNPQSDCFVLVLSSHGHEEEATESSLHLHLPHDASVWRHAVFGVDDRPIYVDDILKLFDCKEGENQLRGKPKLFFIQACQSGHLAYRGGCLTSFDTGASINVALSKKNLSSMQPSDAGTIDDTFVSVVKAQPPYGGNTVLQSETDNWLPGRNTTLNISGGTVPTGGDTRIDPPTAVSPRRMRPTSYDIVSLSCPDDCLVMYPTMPGKFAYRITGVGSYMLHYMCQPKIRDLLLYGHDILQFVTAVNSAMASTEIYYTPTAVEIQDPVERELLKKHMPLKMTACIIHRLSKSLKFVPKPEGSLMDKMRTMKT